MSAPIFVDTNVFLYAFDHADSDRQERLPGTRQLSGPRWSFTSTRSGYAPQHAEIRGEFRDLLAWNPVTADATTLERGWKLQDRYGLSRCDAPMVAATKPASCSYALTTEDLQAGQRFETE
jgi:predicted nucleic acid-binding protein